MMRSQEDCGAHNDWKGVDCNRPAGHPERQHRGYTDDGLEVVWTAHTPRR